MAVLILGLPTPATGKQGGADAGAMTSKPGLKEGGLRTPKSWFFSVKKIGITYWDVIVFLITRFFFPTPEMKARDQGVPKRHRNQESVKWL